MAVTPLEKNHFAEIATSKPKSTPRAIFLAASRPFDLMIVDSLHS